MFTTWRDVGYLPQVGPTQRKGQEGRAWVRARRIPRIFPVRTIFLSWCVLASLLLQSLTWASPALRAERAERLAHEVTHALDHGHHAHEGSGHEVDAMLVVHETHDNPSHGPHHVHVLDNAPWWGLTTASRVTSTLSAGSDPAMEPVRPMATVHLQGPLRPPQSLI